MSGLMDVRAKNFQFAKNKLVKSFNGSGNMDTDLVVTGKAKTGYLEDIRKLVDEWGLIVRKSKACVAMDTIEFMSYYTKSYIIPGQMHQEEGG